MKPLTSLAVMSAFEDGKFHLFDPVSKYLPEFENMSVHVSGSGESMVTRPAENPITIYHLLTHQSGYVYDLPLRNKGCHWLVTAM